jgi:hypothetical protein
VPLGLRGWGIFVVREGVSSSSGRDVNSENLRGSETAAKEEMKSATEVRKRSKRRFKGGGGVNRR